MTKRKRWLRFFETFKIPKRLQAKNGGSTKFYSIYKIIASLMLLNQPLSEILKMDIIDAMSFIQAAANLRNPKQKHGANKKAFP